MEDPTLFGDPDRMQSVLYKDWADDSGGVHSNSGVNNKAAFLMVDGGTFNGRTVTGMGIDKAAKIYYEAEVALLTSGSDYLNLYDALFQACNNLLGTSGITAANCTEVRDATLATEMNLQPTIASTTVAPACPAGQFPKNVWFDDLETPGAGRWTTSGSGAFYYPQNSHPFTGWDFTYGTSGKYNIWGDNRASTSDSQIGMTNAVAIPAAAFLTFQHSYQFEQGFSGTAYDGGVMEYRIGTGAWTAVPAAWFTHGGYDGTIAAGNPLAGREAFVGRSYGYGASRLNLAGLSGQSVRFRYRLGTDSSVGDYGWFIDDVRIHTCSADTIAPTAKAPLQAIPLNSTLGTSTTGASLPAQITWAAATDDRAASSQLVYQLQRKTGTGAFTNVGGWTTRRSQPVEMLTPGVTYQYRVMAKDPAGLIGTATAPAFTPGVAQENASGNVFTGTWLTRLAQATAYGGFVRPTTTANAKVTRTFTGRRNVAVVMPKAATMGNVSVCLFQGATQVICQSSIDLSPSSGKGPRRVVFMRSVLNPALSYRVEVTALSGRAELDAIVLY